MTSTTASNYSYIHYNSDSGLDTHGGVDKASVEVKGAAYGISKLLAALKVLDKSFADGASTYYYTVPSDGYYNITYSYTGTGGGVDYSYTSVSKHVAGDKISMKMGSRIAITRIQ